MIALTEFSNSSCFRRNLIAQEVEPKRVEIETVVPEKVEENPATVNGSVNDHNQMLVVIAANEEEKKDPPDNAEMDIDVLEKSSVVRDDPIIESYENYGTKESDVVDELTVTKYDESLIKLISEENLYVGDTDIKDNSIGELSATDNYVQSKVDSAQFGVRWSMLTDVVNSGIKNIITTQEKIIQETMFEIISSEAKYYSGLEIIMNHYYKSYLFTPKNDKFGYVNPIDKHHIFSNITEVMEVSKRLLTDFEKRWKNDRPYLHDVCDILYEYAISPAFKNYVIYLRNQSYQQEAYQRLMESGTIKKEMLRLQSLGACKSLPLDSYLLMPMQRLTRYKLLAENVLKALMHDSIDKEIYKTQIENAHKAIQQISLLLSLSQSGKIELDNKALLIDLLNKITFPKDCKMLSFNGKVLLKECEYNIDSCVQKHGPKVIKRSSLFILLLFNDLMMIGKRNGSRVKILDYCARKDVVYTSRVAKMIQERKDTKHLYYINDEDDWNNPRIYLKFENSCNGYLRDPIILKVPNRDEISSWENYLPDYLNLDIYDYSRPSNFSYWSTVRRLSNFSNL